MCRLVCISACAVSGSHALGAMWRLVLRQLVAAGALLRLCRCARCQYADHPAPTHTAAVGVGGGVWACPGVGPCYSCGCFWRAAAAVGAVCTLCAHAASQKPQPGGGTLTCRNMVLGQRFRKACAIICQWAGSATGSPSTTGERMPRAGGPQFLKP